MQLKDKYHVLVTNDIDRRRAVKTAIKRSIFDIPSEFNEEEAQSALNILDTISDNDETFTINVDISDFGIPYISVLTRHDIGVYSFSYFNLPEDVRLWMDKANNITIPFTFILT